MLTNFENSFVSKVSKNVSVSIGLERLGLGLGLEPEIKGLGHVSVSRKL